jgi:hypothetical protein
MAMDVAFSNLFRDGSAIEQVRFLDDFYELVDIDAESSTELSDLLITAINQSGNRYIKRTAFKRLCELTLLGKITNAFATLGLLQAFLSDTDTGLQTIALKFVHYFSDQLTDDLMELIKALSDSPDGEVASQAYLELGLIRLTTGLQLSVLSQLVIRLGECQALFHAAAQSSENRVDADFLVALVKWGQAVLSEDSDSAASCFAALEANLRSRVLYTNEERELELDYLIFRQVQLLRQSFELAAGAKRWPELRPNIEALLRLQTECADTGLVDAANRGLIDRLNQKLLSTLADHTFSLHLQSEKERLAALRPSIAGDSLNAFIGYLLGIFPDEAESRPENYALLAMLAEHLGSDAGLTLYHQVQRKDLSLEKALGSLLERQQDNRQPFKTGSIQGEEVLLSLMSGIDLVLPAYPAAKRQAFMNILEEVIRYTRVTFTNNDKRRFQFLFSAAEGGKGQAAIEQDLQDSMLVFFEHSRIADGLEHEKAKFVDGGRVDILYKKDLITIPLELKKSLSRPDQAGLEQNYIAQAQTYTAGYDQLGIFILLELSDKSKEPPPNFKDWFKIHHLAPATLQTVQYPDYIVSVIIPGNRTLPSAKSTYK